MLAQSNTVNSTKPPMELAKFSPKVQRLVNWFVFFLAFPAFDLLGFSLTFYYFIALIIQCGLFWKKPHRGKVLFVGFLIIGTISTIFTPIPEVFESLEFAKMLIQVYYWVGVAIFFIVYYQRIDLIQLSKWLFYGIILYTIFFYFIGFNFKSALVSITSTPGRNAYVFNMLACAPISFYYFKDKTRLKIIAYMLFLLIAMLFSNGRSGAIIVLIELLLISIIVFPSIKRISKFFIPLFLGLFIISQMTFFEAVKYEIAAQVEPISPRFASLITGEGEGDLSKDKSWLIRKLMIDKGEEIFYNYPFLGIGPGNFKAYDAELKSFVQYDRLTYRGHETFSSGFGAHNTYLQSITEFGLLGSICFFLLLALPLFRFIIVYFKNKITLQHLVLVSLLGICIHFYAIANLTGGLPWFVIGLSWGVLNQFKKLSL